MTPTAASSLPQVLQEKCLKPVCVCPTLQTQVHLTLSVAPAPAAWCPHLGCLGPDTRTLPWGTLTPAKQCPRHSSLSLKAEILTSPLRSHNFGDSSCFLHLLLLTHRMHIFSFVLCSFSYHMLSVKSPCIAFSVFGLCLSVANPGAGTGSIRGKK